MSFKSSYYPGFSIYGMGKIKIPMAFLTVQLYLQCQIVEKKLVPNFRIAIWNDRICNLFAKEVVQIDPKGETKAHTEGQAIFSLINEKRIKFLRVLDQRYIYPIGLYLSQYKKL